MKPSLFILALFITSFVNAQKYEFGFNGGINYTSSLRNLTPYTFIENPSGATLSHPLTLSLKLLRNHNKWQYGVALESGEAKYKYQFVHFEYSSYYNPFQDDIPPIYGVSVANYYPVKFILNRKFKTGNYKGYAGLNAGYVFIPMIGSNNKEMVQPFNDNNYYGLCAGLQVGTTRYISRHIGINAEFDANYLQFRQGRGSLLSFNTYSLNFGIRYRL